MIFTPSFLNTLRRARQIVWQQGELKFKIKRTRNVFSLPEGEAVAAGMLATMIFKEKAMYVGQHTVVHLRWLGVASTARREATWDC